MVRTMKIAKLITNEQAPDLSIILPGRNGGRRDDLRNSTEKFRVGVVSRRERKRP
jgi:hypothetical protein